MYNQKAYYMLNTMLRALMLYQVKSSQLLYETCLKSPPLRHKKVLNSGP